MTASGHELEVKFLLFDPSALQARLSALGASLTKPRVHEVNLRFDTLDSALKRNMQVLRLRQDQEARLTFKGPSEDEGGVRKRREIELTVGDFQAAQDLLEALGYRVVVIYEKYRTSYAWLGAQILLDEMPYGHFVEIEVPDPELIRTIGDRLGLDWEKRLLDSYTLLFEKLRQVHGFTFRDLSFDNFVDLVVDFASLGISPADR